MSPKFYVYIYLDPRNYEPFYVGKGYGNRAYRHLVDDGDTLKVRKIKKLKRAGYTPVIKFPFKGLSEQDAFDFEKALIFVIGRRDLKLGPLCNMTDGGDGPAGNVQSKATKRKIASAAKDRWSDPSYRGKMSSIHSHRQIGNKLSDEHKRKLSKAMKGRKKTNEHKRKISASITDKYNDPKYKESLSNSLRKRWKDPEYRGKMADICTNNLRGRGCYE
jgi:hypothetical protein